MRTLSHELMTLARLQHGLLSTRQLAADGFSSQQVGHRIKRGEWQRISSIVIALHPLPLDRMARLSAAALHYERCGLAGSSVLELFGMPEPLDHRIHLVGPRAGRREPLAECSVHTSTWCPIEQVHPRRVDLRLAVLEAVAWSVTDRQAVFHMVWPIQHGLLTLHELQQSDFPIRHSPQFGASIRRRLSLVEPGVHSMPEYDFARECLRRGLPQPHRQRMRMDSTGHARYTDVEFTVDGNSLIVEIDGLHHLATEVHIDDQWRSNELLLQGAPVLRIPAVALRTDPEPFFEQLTRALNALRRPTRPIGAYADS